MAADFQILEGEDQMTDYQISPETIHHLFCKRCGVKPFGRGNLPSGRPFYAVNVVCLDEAAIQEWVDAPVVFQDGRLGKRGSIPVETSYL